jgi:hypothetical protein
MWLEVKYQVHLQYLHMIFNVKFYRAIEMKSGLVAMAQPRVLQHFG